MQPQSFTPAEVARNQTDSGAGKATRGTWDVILLGILGGAYTGFASLLFLIASHDSAAFLGVGVSRLLGGSVFTLGVALAILSGGELFSGNALMIISALERKISGRLLLRNWLLVWLANLLGALLLVGLVQVAGTGSLNGGAVGEYALAVAQAKLAYSWPTALARGILANWLICLAVWMAAAARDVTGKLLAIYLPIMAFVACGFENSVANMFFLPYGLLQAGSFDAAGFLGALADNLLPVSLGNAIGGAIFVGAAYWCIYLRRK